jgi:tetratricopeptide (TPR) repeat protein
MEPPSQDQAESDIESYLNVAKSYIEIDENKLAIDALLKAYKIDDTNYDITYHLAFAYFLEAEYDKALKFFDEAIEINPDNRDAYYYKAIVLMRKNKLSKALKCFKLLPNDHYALYQQGLIYLHKNEKKKAAILLTKAKELGNQDAEEALLEI